jgi:anaerobic ribonucleoside-triphosphate reductase activating protein
VTSAARITQAPPLRVHQFLPESWANGPGRRAVLWLQGCTLGCPGCFNPETHPISGGALMQVDEVFDRITAHAGDLEGVTFSGGEPLQQLTSLRPLIHRLHRETDLSILLFTGYTWQEVLAMPHSHAWLACLDVVIAGRYDARQHLAQGHRSLRGSANQTIHLLSSRYTEGDLEGAPPAEVIITVDGLVALSGIDPLWWQPPE